MAKKKGGLGGKGLNALLKADEGIEQNSIENNEPNNLGIQKVELAKIIPNPDQPRKVFDEEHIRGLAESIESNGLINPLTLRLKDGQYQIISGERRFRALKSLGREFGEAIVLDVGDERMLEITLVENIQRADLNSIEVAQSYRKLIDDFNLTHDEIAKRVGKSRSTITNSMRILELSEDIRALIIADKISEGHARVLLREKDEDMRRLLAAEIIEKNLSVRDLENLFKENSSEIDPNALESGEKGVVLEAGENALDSDNQGQDKDAQLAPVKDANHRKIENDLEKIFATKVNLVSKDFKAGKIVIEYYSPEDLMRIIDILEKDTLASSDNQSKTGVIHY